MYVGQSLQSEHHNALIHSVVAFVINFHDGESYASLQSQNSPKPPVFFAQVFNIMQQELIEGGPGFLQKLETLVLETLQGHDFNAGSFPFVAPNLIQFMTLLTSQQTAFKVVSTPFLGKMAELNQGKLFNHFALSYSCQLGFHKHIQEILEECEHKELTELMPNQDNCRPTFQYVKNKRDRDASMSSNGDAQKEKNAQDAIDEEVELIMKAIAQKGDGVIEGLKTLLADKEQIKSEGILLKQVFLEVIFTKFGTHSLEHVTRGFEKVKVILEEQYHGHEDAQRMALDTIFKSFNMDQLSAQDFAKENLFQLREKICNLVMRLNQLGIIDTQIAINWCLDQLSAFQGNMSLNFTHCYLVLSLIQKSQSQRSYLVTKFAQEFDKPSEVKIETPYEARMREQAEAEGVETKSQEEKKEKTPEDIAA